MANGIWPKWQTSFLNGKATFLICFPTNINDVWGIDGLKEDLCTNTNFFEFGW